MNRIVEDRPEALDAARSRAPRTSRLVAAATIASLALLATNAAADVRCGRDLQLDVCREANPTCPAVSSPLGVSPGAWPVYQADVQHTGQSVHRGPSCGGVRWKTKLQGRLLSAPILAQGNPGESDSLFVPVGKAPLCALDPASGQVRWCGTDQKGKRADRSAPVVGNGNQAFIGTRDNDLWAITVPPLASANATVTWRQKVCTDGDITVPPIIGADGLIYMASDSLGAGTLIAMCPGPARQPKWCVNPVGGGIRNASPALSPSGDALYVTVAGSALAAFHPQTGSELWRAQLEPRRSVGRTVNYAPVVDPVTGRVYVGLRKGLWAVDPPAAPGGQPTARLLFDTQPARESMEAPPAIDVARGTIVFGASRGQKSTLYAIDRTGLVRWKRTDLGRGRFRNNPPVLDADGRVYVALGKSLIALGANGAPLWRSEFSEKLAASPILGDGVLYVGGTRGNVHALGCAA